MNLPNWLSVFRILLIVPFVGFAYAPGSWGLWVSAGIFILASVTDWLDGHLARTRNQITTLGKFMDPIADKMLITVGMLLLMSIGRMPPWVVMLFVVRDLAVDGLRMVAAAQHHVMAAGIWGKVKTTVQIVAVIMLLIDNFPFAYLGVPMAGIVMYAALGFSLYSGYDYFIKNKSVFRS